MASFSDLIVTGMSRFINSVRINGDLNVIGYINGFKIVETSLGNYNSITKDPNTIYLITS